MEIMIGLRLDLIDAIEGFFSDKSYPNILELLLGAAAGAHDPAVAACS